LPTAPPVNLEEILDLSSSSESPVPTAKKPVTKKKVRPVPPPKKTVESSDPEIQAGEEEFWNWTGPK
jgi:hypothetical protein